MLCTAHCHTACVLNATGSAWFAAFGFGSAFPLSDAVLNFKFFSLYPMHFGRTNFIKEYSKTICSERIWLLLLKQRFILQIQTILFIAAQCKCNTISAKRISVYAPIFSFAACVSQLFYIHFNIFWISVEYLRE